MFLIIYYFKFNGEVCFFYLRERGHAKLDEELHCFNWSKYKEWG